MSALYRLLAYARPHRARLAGALAAMVIYAAASATLATLVKPIFDSVLPARERLVSTIVAILIVYAAKGLGAYLSQYLMTDVGQRVVRDLRNLMFRHMLGQSAAFFTTQTTGRLMSRITNDVSQVQRAVSDTIGDLARESLTLIGYLAVLIYYDARLTVVCLTSAPLIVYPLVRLGQRVRRTTRRTQEAQEQMAHLSAEALTGHRIVKAFGAEAREAAKFEQSSDRYYRTSMRVTGVLSVLPPLMEMIGGVAFATALWVGSQEIASKRLTTGDFVAFITALFLMYAPARKLSRVNADLQQAAAAAERIFEILETHSEVQERPDALPLPRFAKSIEFRDVHFSYGAEHEPTLQGVTLTVGAGQMLAIVGRSGAGKTTLVNLLPRFYDVTNGAILIDGRDVRDVTLASLRSQIGLVTQETVLFDDTIVANIAYGLPHATRDAIEAAARAAHAHDFILGLDHGYETTIGERGQRLSGGQRQRLAIARAILRDSPILILDEATSSLDAESEALVQDALVALMRNRTSFVIAHRLSTVRRADAIVVLEQGRIVECGTHDELMARRGAYAKLYELQFEDEPPEIETLVIKSMTGFASLTHEDERATIGVTVRAVNHRFLDLQLRLPQSFGDVEPRVRSLLQKRLARGRVELGISVQVRNSTTPSVELNEQFASALDAAIEQARSRGLVSGALSPGDLLRLPQAITVRERPPEADPAVEARLAISIEAAVEQALADLDAMRVREGGHLRNDLDGRQHALALLIERLRVAAEDGRVELERRLRERIDEIALELPVDQAMIAQEIVRAAQRSDISEEVTRFRAHLAHWTMLVDGDEPCGRKLDFLLQEMNREINTIGAKADGLGVSELIINAKAELERMREQVQNVE